MRGSEGITHTFMGAFFFRFAFGKLFYYYREVKKNNRKFLKISQRIFIAQRIFFFSEYILQGSKFFWSTFLGCSSACNAHFHRFFRLSTPKRCLKTPRCPQNSKFHHVKVSPKPLHYMISGSHARYLFRPKGFLVPQLKITYFGDCWTLIFRKTIFFFGLKKTNV